MTFWLDAQLPPKFAQWLAATFEIEAISLYDVGLRDAQDIEIFEAARKNGLGTVIITKDRDFVDLVVRLGVPPQILWLTCGNITNRGLQEIFLKIFPEALALLKAGEMIVEIGKDS